MSPLESRQVRDHCNLGNGWPGKPGHPYRDRALGTGPYVHDAHHLVVFVREDVAVPDVASGLVERHLDARDLVGQRRDHVLRRVLDIAVGGACIIDNRTCLRIDDPEALSIRIWIAGDGVVLHRRLRNKVRSIPGG